MLFLRDQAKRIIWETRAFQLFFPILIFTASASLRAFFCVIQKGLLPASQTVLDKLRARLGHVLPMDT